MDAVIAPCIATGDGTCERAWRGWLRRRTLPRVSAHELVPPGQRIVVVAPHPDDEVLMVGGLLALLAVEGRSMLVVAVTDGEASHPGSHAWTPERLARIRPAESARALQRLDAEARFARLRLPDGGVAAHVGHLTARLHALLQPGDAVFTTWCLDGHPDHEATARATQSAATACGSHLFEVPVWGWHWAAVGDARMPWSRARVVPLARHALRRKHAAVQAFATQWICDPSCAETPVLRPSTLRRAARPFELVFA